MKKTAILTFVLLLVCILAFACGEKEESTGTDSVSTVPAGSETEGSDVSVTFKVAVESGEGFVRMALVQTADTMRRVAAQVRLMLH